MCSLYSQKRKGHLLPMSACKGRVSALWSNHQVVWAPDGQVQKRQKVQGRNKEEETTSFSWDFTGLSLKMWALCAGSKWGSHGCLWGSGYPMGTWAPPPSLHHCAFQRSVSIGCWSLSQRALEISCSSSASSVTEVTGRAVSLCTAWDIPRCSLAATEIHVKPNNCLTAAAPLVV